MNPAATALSYTTNVHDPPGVGVGLTAATVLVGVVVGRTVVAVRVAVEASVGVAVPFAPVAVGVDVGWPSTLARWAL
jgi:hypothetical protein